MFCEKKYHINTKKYAVNAFYLATYYSILQEATYKINKFVNPKKNTWPKAHQSQPLYVSGELVTRTLFFVLKIETQNNAFDLLGFTN